MGHTGQTESHLAKWVRLKNNGSHLEIMGHTYKIGRTWKYGSHLANLVTLRNNGSHL